MVQNKPLTAVNAQFRRAIEKQVQYLVVIVAGLFDKVDQNGAVV